MLFMRRLSFFLFFFFNDTATTEIYTLSLHDALPISVPNSAAPTSSPPALLFTVRCLSGMCNGSLPVLTGSLNWAAQPSKGRTSCGSGSRAKSSAWTPAPPTPRGGRFAQPVFLQHLLDAR